MTFNTALAVRVLANIEETEENRERDLMGWDQSHWGYIGSLDQVRAAVEAGDDLVWDDKGNLVGTGTCGTAMCFAGWALSLEGVKLRWETTDSDPESASFIATYAEDGRSIEAVAADLLGMHGPEFDIENLPHEVVGDQEYDYTPLFHEGNQLDRLYGLCAHYAGMSENDLRAEVQSHRQEERDRLERIRSRMMALMPQEG